MSDNLLTNRVWEVIQEELASRPRKSSNTGFINICCPICTRRGESADKKFRCGIKSDMGIAVTCFNCNFRSRFLVGERLSFNMREFLRSLGVAEREIKRLAFWADQVRVSVARDPEMQARLNVQISPEFPSAEFPAGTRSLQEWADDGCTDPNYLGAVEYLLSRGDVITRASTYYWTPQTEHHLNRRLIIPCHHERRLVGWVGRSTATDITPRYHKHTPSNLLFNAQQLHRSQHKYVFIVEGVFDALAIDGVAGLGATLNDHQIAWIKRSDKQPVVIPDRDAAGSRLVDIAIREKWSVATPHYGRYQWWEPDIKDVDEAVARYGKLYTVQSVIATITDHPIQIRQRTSYRVR